MGLLTLDTLKAQGVSGFCNSPHSTVCYTYFYSGSPFLSKTGKVKGTSDLVHPVLLLKTPFQPWDERQYLKKKNILIKKSETLLLRISPTQNDFSAEFVMLLIHVLDQVVPQNDKKQAKKLSSHIYPSFSQPFNSLANLRSGPPPPPPQQNIFFCWGEGGLIAGYSLVPYSSFYLW